MNTNRYYTQILSAAVKDALHAESESRLRYGLPLNDDSFWNVAEQFIPIPEDATDEDWGAHAELMTALIGYANEVGLPNTEGGPEAPEVTDQQAAAAMRDDIRAAAALEGISPKEYIDREFAKLLGDV